MHNYTLRTTVNRQEAEALKEMIFKRVRERAENLTEETKNSYTANTHYEVMDLARASVSSSRNPFMPAQVEKEQDQKFEKAVEKTVVYEAQAPEKVEKKEVEGLGFSQRKPVQKINAGIQNSAMNVQKAVEESAISSNMVDARKEFDSKQLFVGALNFLNTQASIELSNSKKVPFEILA